MYFFFSCVRVISIKFKKKKKKLYLTKRLNIKLHFLRLTPIVSNAYAILLLTVHGSRDLSLWLCFSQVLFEISFKKST